MFSYVQEELRKADNPLALLGKRYVIVQQQSDQFIGFSVAMICGIPLSIN